MLMPSIIEELRLESVSNKSILDLLVGAVEIDFL